MISVSSSTAPIRLGLGLLLTTSRAGSRTPALPEPVPTARMGAPPFITKYAQEPDLFCKI